MEPSIQQFIQQLVNGLTLGSMYALIALGYTMVYGILELINFAHGEVVMVGAYTALGVLVITLGAGLPWGLAFALALVGAVLVCCLLGVGIERLAYRPLLGEAKPLNLLELAALTGVGGGVWVLYTLLRGTYSPIAIAQGLGVGVIGAAALGGLFWWLSQAIPSRKAPKLSLLITALGMSIFLQNAVRLIAGSRDQVLPQVLPAITWRSNGVQITLTQVLILGVSVFLMAALTFLIQKTRLGKAMRATAQDMQAAQLMGINTEQIVVITFILGSSLGAVAGVLFGVFFQTINFFIGFQAGLKAFTAAVLGGIGNIPGAMLGGLLLGVIESLGAGYLSSEWKDVFAFTILVGVLLFRPSGLLGENVPDKV
jgi:branched-chain amino acid transport system permease protein